MSASQPPTSTAGGRAEKWFGIALIGILVLFGLAYCSNGERLRIEAIFNDISAGKFTGGALTGHFETGCLSPNDAYNYRWAGSSSTSLEANSQIRTKLLESGRCAISPENSRFDMTAEGMLRFTTPHGVIDLYPVSKGTP